MNYSRLHQTQSNLIQNITNIKGAQNQVQNNKHKCGWIELNSFIKRDMVNQVFGHFPAGSVGVWPWPVGANKAAVTILPASPVLQIGPFLLLQFAQGN